MWADQYDVVELLENKYKQDALVVAVSIISFIIKFSMYVHTCVRMHVRSYV